MMLDLKSYIFTAAYPMRCGLNDELGMDELKRKGFFPKHFSCLDQALILIFIKCISLTAKANFATHLWQMDMQPQLMKINGLSQLPENIH